MHVQAVLIAVFAQVALTFAILLRLAVIRRMALNARAVDIGEVAVDTQKWPDPIRKVANAFRNQFELPVLFYVICILAIVTRQADTLFVVLAWTFVATRLVHAFIATTYNKLIHRGFAFALGCLTLMIMWIVFALDIVFGI